MELIGIFFIACGLLVLAGVAKAVRPDDTTRALVLLLPTRLQRVAPLNVGRQSVRMGALIEAAIGVVAVLFPRPWTAVMVATSYALFVCLVAYARRHGGSLSTCGCFGRPDTPATGLHLVLNIVLLVAAVSLALHSPHPTELGPLLETQPWSGLPLLLAAGVGVWLAYLALSPLSALEAARRLVGQPHEKTLNS
jgi:hypothetical protein